MASRSIFFGHDQSKSGIGLKVATLALWSLRSRPRRCRSPSSIVNTSESHGLSAMRSQLAARPKRPRALSLVFTSVGLRSLMVDSFFESVVGGQGMGRDDEAGMLAGRNRHREW